MSAAEPALRVHRAGPRPVAGRVADPVGATVALVAAACDVHESEIRAVGRGPRRRAFARHVAIYLLHVVHGLSLSAIARIVDRDRTTVRHAVRLVEDRRESPRFDAWLASLEGHLSSFRGDAR